MRPGCTYEVFVADKPIRLVGSTILTLKQRRSNGYVKRFGPEVELRLIREIPRHETEDDVSYNFHLKAAEALDIVRKKTYLENGGLNKVSPLIQAIGHPVLEAEMGHLGGKISGRINVENGHLARIRTPEHQREAGRISGRKAVDSGRLATIQTSENQAKAGRVAVESGQIQALGRTEGRKRVESGLLASVCHLGSKKAKALGVGIFAAGMQVKGNCISLCKRWNINRGKPCVCGAHNV